ncbi:LysR family transcriptional regulator [Sporomusaceae bacterium FL31]|nr:LysR family transcriptional regulator [Sporomusaceae bacterium FL31]GCE34918.1 LysR family transcriptional regulator [Sporomusaceae bacterium]
MLGKYELFIAVVESGSLTKAAELLHITQSGVSHAIASLESELGVSLLTRDRSGITLTSNGEHMLQSIREVLQANDRIKQKVAAIKGVEIGTVRIGTFTSVSAQWLPGVIKEFQNRHPAIEIKLAEGDYDDIEHWIANGSVDFGFVSLPTAKNFHVIPLKKDKLLCILPKEHPLQYRDKICFDQIEEEAFIMTKYGSTDDIRRMLNENHVKTKVKYEVTEEQAILEMVQHGLGISILPEMTLFRKTHNVCIVEFEKPVYRTIGIAMNSTKHISPATRKFLDCLQAWLKQEEILLEDVLAEI